MRFKHWFRENLQPDKERQLQQVWADTFKSLGLGGLSDEDAAHQSLGKITFGARSLGRGPDSTFKGKQAVRKRLENGQIFNRLEQLNDPNLRKTIEDTRKWLDTEDAEHSANASTTVSTLLQKLFGSYFQKFIDSDFPKPDQAKAQVQPQPPKQTGATQQDPSTNAPAGPPPPAQPDGMPQAGPVTPPVANPMPPKPAGAELGLF